ncbi:site-specific integrase [Pelobacter seleniigenes]|uniref:site-specific integrase n=1 Tax=Pelobacter seleniigenes TaxID=407188 RepID=UPI0004A73ED5|nr:site-specific integrase [Pelobacter seleniigenes]
MASIRTRNNFLFFDFRYKSVRCREQTLLKDTPENRKKLEPYATQIDREIKAGTFQYEKYFPNSKNLEKVQAPVKAKPVDPKEMQAVCSDSPSLKEFSEEWFEENLIRWKLSHQETVRGILDKHLIPRFGDMNVSHITKGDILKFRSSLAKVQIGNKTGLSPMRINHIMTSLRMILNDAADRFQFITPFQGIKPLKVPRSDVDPFTIDEVRLILSTVRLDFRNYYEVRFFTGMRTGEIDGLKWKYVDFNRREILVRETLVRMREENTKTPGSVREIQMSEPVYQALKAQWEVTGKLSQFVFCNRNGTPLDHTNVTKRIWYPTLEMLGMKRRRPYQTRHTTATLWLASGENPEWIARQMGHSSTTMLFTVYSRFVPNLTRRDGTAFENLLAARINGGDHDN